MLLPFRSLLLPAALLLCAFVLLTPDAARGQSPRSERERWVIDSTYFVTAYRKVEVMIPMRDGIRLHTVLYVPRDASAERPYPILLTRTPYSCRPYGAAYSALWAAPSRMKLVREGFILATQDVRGRWASEGEFTDVRPQVPGTDKKNQKEIDESTDTYDTVDWLVKNVAGNNGAVGIHGVSYPGFYTTVAGLSGHPALKAISPQAPVTDWFIGDDVHHGGAFFWMDFYDFLPWFLRDDPRYSGPPQADPLDGVTDNYDFFLHQVQTPRRANEAFFRDSIPFWKEILAHPNYDAFWQARNPMPHAREVKPAVLTVGGWFDAEDLWGALHTYGRFEAQNPGINNKLVMGPWCHGCWWSNAEGLGDIAFGQRTGDYYIDSLFLPFMNRHLKGKGSDGGIAEATIFETGANRWRKFAQWPPRHEPQSLYLHPGRLLSSRVPSGAGTLDYVSDPASPVPYQGRVHTQRTRDYMLDDQRFASRRPDVLTFESEVLSEDLTLAGPVVAELLASMSGTDADFVVKLIDEFPTETPPAQFKPSPSTPPQVMGGYQMLVRGEVLRGRFRNSWEKPEAFKPNQPTRVRVTLPDVCHTFKKGHRVVVQVQSSWFPLVDRNPQQFIDIYQAQPSDYRRATIRIHYGGAAGSRVVLPVLR